MTLSGLHRGSAVISVMIFVVLAGSAGVLLKYSFKEKSVNEVKMLVAEVLFKDIRDLRNMKPLIKEGVPLHVVGSYDPNEKKVCKCLLPVDFRSRIDAKKISELKACSATS